MDEGTWTTPFKMVYGVKPDWRNLVPIFSLSYVKQKRDASGFRSTVDSQSIKAICEGNDKKSNDLLFYLPFSHSLISSSNYTLDPTVPSVPVFNLYYDGHIGFDLYTSSSEQMQPPAYKTGKDIYYKTDNMENYAHGTIIVSPTKEDNLATIQNKTTKDILQ
eukprot:7921394-Ditylum_brightwellii.AAC.1